MTDETQANDGAPVSHEFVCPLELTHDKFGEAHFFIGRMLSEYHHPQPFRWNLNAFLQAFRSIPITGVSAGLPWALLMPC